VVLRAHDVSASIARLHGVQYRAGVSPENGRPPRIWPVALGPMRKRLRIARWPTVRHGAVVVTGNGRSLSSSILRVARRPTVRYGAVAVTGNAASLRSGILRVAPGLMRRILRIAGWQTVRYAAAVFTGNGRPPSRRILLVVNGPTRGGLPISEWHAGLFSGNFWRHKLHVLRVCPRPMRKRLRFASIC